MLQNVQPDEVYNLAAMSFVPTSWQQPVLTGEFTGHGRDARCSKPFASSIRGHPLLPGPSSEMFGKVRETLQCETTPFHPCSPYGVAKVYGHFITVNYRESYDMYRC